jgi:predicted regulator of amino acid metabolism with ACT domain
MTTFSDSDVNKLKRLISEGIQVKEEVKTLNDGLKDTVKAIAEELGIKPAVLNKAIAIAHKAEFGKQRDDFEELESILQSVGRAE